MNTDFVLYLVRKQVALEQELKKAEAIKDFSHEYHATRNQQLVVDLKSRIEDMKTILTEYNNMHQPVR